MALPIIDNWKSYFLTCHEGLGSSYERIILNKLLLFLKTRYNIKSVLETPLFGFTGLSGLNSVILSKAGCTVTVTDHDLERIELILALFKKIETEINVTFTPSYTSLPFENKSHDMSLNFSAIWFVEDLTTFLVELDRVTSKIILICVPNKSGLGFRWQKAHSSIAANVTFHEKYIDPENIIEGLTKLHWTFINEEFIDCPPWPDIGMSKELLFRKLFVKKSSGKENVKYKKPLSIIDFYKGKDPEFSRRMEKYGLFENYAPTIFKKYWAHHKWLLFLKDINEN